MSIVLDICCSALFIASAVALPAFPTLQGPWNAQDTTSSSATVIAALPILQGPWNSPETTTSSLTGSSSSTAFSTPISVSFLNSSLSSSSSTSPGTKSSRSTSTLVIPSSALSQTQNQTLSLGANSSASSTVIRSSTSSAGGIDERSSSPGDQSTASLVSRSIVTSTIYPTISASISPPGASQKSSSSGFISTPRSSSIGTGGQSPFPSASGIQPLTSVRSNAFSGSLLSASTAVSNSTSPASKTLAPSTLAVSLSITNTSALAAASPSLNACGVVAQYYNPTPKDWTDYNTDAWLNTWVGNNVGPIAANVNGFTGAFATWAVGNPDFSCRDNGSPTDCDFNPCNIPILNAKGVDVRPTYYVMESLVRIHTYFAGLRESFTVDAIGAALSKDEWAETFYKDKDDKSVVGLREVFNAVAMIVGIVAALSGLGGLVGTSASRQETSLPIPGTFRRMNNPDSNVSFASSAGTIAAVSASVYNGAAGSVTPTLGQHVDDTFKKSADLGGILGNIVIGAVESFTSANNILMHGQNYIGTGDLRDYFRGGAFVDYPGVDKNAVTNQMNAFLIGQAINQLYRQQKIFILGGGACGDNQGIGEGPQANSICRNGKVWYLYWWQEVGHFTLNMHQWGWVSPPPGSDQLGQGDYAAVTVQDILNSSLDAYIAAGYNYNNVTAFQRAQSAITQQWANPAAQGPAWEGIFTIPVCNVSASIGSDYYDRDWILQDYGHDSRPVWCGPICDGDIQKTRDFIHAANMDNFESPRHMCDDDDADINWWYPPP